MTNDDQHLVSSGYDLVADAYLERFGVSTVRQRWFARLLSGLPASGGRVLDLGCGAGVPVARDLTVAGHAVVGVDGSPQQISRARRNAPAATFLQADMSKLAFAPGSFDAVCAFYSITHVPPAQQAALIASIADWLRPNGVFVASFGAGPAGQWTGDWLGTTMFFGDAGEAETQRSLANAGLSVRHSAVERQDNEDSAFLWIEATKDHPPVRAAGASL